MKKILIIFALLVLPAYSYNFDSQNMKFILSAKADSKYEKLMEKARSAQKTDKKIKYYNKVLQENPTYLPAVYELTFAYIEKGSAKDVLNSAQKLRMLNTDKTLPDDMITDIIARSELRLNRYSDAVQEFEKITSPHLVKRNYTILAATYLKLDNFQKTIDNASKVTADDYNYYEAQELLYSANYRLKNFPAALKYAKNLINLDPTKSVNYLRAAYACDKNDTQKLDFLKRGKKVLLNDPNEQLYTVDEMIAELEQIKIDKAYEKLTDFVVKPDWKTVYINNSPNLNFYIANWSKRQDEFYATANNCIAKYTGTNLVKCFEALNASQEKQTQELKERLKEIKDKQMMYEQQLKMERILREQMYYYYAPYNYYHYYMPYRFIPYW